MVLDQHMIVQRHLSLGRYQTQTAMTPLHPLASAGTIIGIAVCCYHCMLHLFLHDRLTSDAWAVCKQDQQGHRLKWLVVGQGASTALVWYLGPWAASGHVQEGFRMVHKLLNSLIDSWLSVVWAGA